MLNIKQKVKNGEWEKLLKRVALRGKYKRILSFSNYLREKIDELKPKDMIDVQSFMWCMNPETIKVVTQYKLENPDYWKE